MVQWVEALGRTRRTFTKGIARFFTAKNDFNEEAAEDLEEALIKADVAPALAMAWIAEIEKRYGGLRTSKREMLRDILLKEFGDEAPFSWGTADKPQSILLVGVNGSGKTTTAAKLAHRAEADGLKALLGAADTYRAAGSDQLRIWAEKVGCGVVAGKTGADAAAVAYDCMDAALARDIDVLIVDTAGRMHTKEPLMRELDKLRRAMTKRHEQSPHEVWAVLDASLGQNALRQALVFHETVPLSGIVVTKLDGSSKAGFLFSVLRELGVPVRFVGLGEGAEDLVPFDAGEFVDALLGPAEEANG